MSWAAVGAAAIGAGASLYAGNKAEDAAYAEGQRVDQLERERFAAVQKEIEQLRQKGDIAEAVAVEEALKAEFGAEKLEKLGQEYAQSAQEAARVREIEARNLYDRIQGATSRREELGREGADSILAAAREGGLGLQDATTRSADLLQDAFGGIQDRYSPYLTSERNALSQLNTEFGLGPGDQNTAYRSSPAYEAAMEASRVAQDEAVDTINQDAANSGTLYSGRRGEALIDRATRGSYERAGIEQSYYQNYLNMLRDMSQPVATSAVSDYQASTADRIGQNYIGSAKAQLEAQTRAAEAAAMMQLASARTGNEGSYLINALPTGTEGAEFALKTVGS